MYYIYQIRHITTNKKYIGSSRCSPFTRWQQHFFGLKNHYHQNPLFQKEWDDDLRNWEFTILEFGEDISPARLLEIEASYILCVPDFLRLNTSNRTIRTKERNNRVVEMLENGEPYDKIKSETGLSKTMISTIRQTLPHLPQGKYKAKV